MWAKLSELRFNDWMEYVTKLNIGMNSEIPVSSDDEPKVASPDKIVSYQKEIFCPSSEKKKKEVHSTYSHCKFIILATFYFGPYWARQVVWGAQSSQSTSHVKP